ncbi:MAG TPA: TlpA disulfide reductase family protein [Phototrophicaceae bacterium]|nr:TlpA disulfide reductase family protein [Phototrophicaceae bacterium]
MRKFLTALILLVLCAACSAQDATPQAGTAVTPFPAPDFTLDTLSGGQLSLASMRGRWVILNFWATWCAPCTSEMPALQAIANQLSGQVGLFGVNMREKADDIRTFMTRNHLSFPILLNPDDATLAAYNLSVGIPQTVLITPKGQVVWHQYGPIDLDTFRTTFDQLRAAQS